MVLGLIILLISLGLSALLSYLSYLGLGIYFIWIGIVAFPLIYILVFLLYVVFIFIWGKFFNTKKEVKGFNKFYYWFLYQTDSLLLPLLNIKVKVIGKEKLPKLLKSDTEEK